MRGVVHQLPRDSKWMILDGSDLPGVPGRGSLMRDRLSRDAAALIRVVTRSLHQNDVKVVVDLLSRNLAVDGFLPASLGLQKPGRQPHESALTNRHPIAGRVDVLEDAPVAW